MSAEALLKKFRLHAPAGAARERVLAAVRRRLREARLWRWTWAAAAAALAVAVPLNAALDGGAPPAPTIRLEEDVRRLTRSIGSDDVEFRLRLAFGPVPGRLPREVP